MNLDQQKLHTKPVSVGGVCTVNMANTRKGRLSPFYATMRDSRRTPLYQTVTNEHKRKRSELRLGARVAIEDSWHCGSARSSWIHSVSVFAFARLTDYRTEFGGSDGLIAFGAEKRGRDLSKAQTEMCVSAPRSPHFPLSNTIGRHAHGAKNGCIFRDNVAPVRFGLLVAQDQEKLPGAGLHNVGHSASPVSLSRNVSLQNDNGQDTETRGGGSAYNSSEISWKVTLDPGSPLI
ncbi:hypothetical protein N7510_000551 [Penicillium lagena]|uniref:uncharacterized protein n=1 Tax=Penicillium lagena TaxID=94218 RepID=UPI0025416DDC|nr:uncharacterized protein N7510_000551 [Penicillium lagena]KAJ5624242.1 hypothetical protein N7510_000551 [Penicillium lagena]